MKLLVGWWNPRTTQLVDIPGFDAVAIENPTGWLPAFVETDPILDWMRHDEETK